MKTWRTLLLGASFASLPGSALFAAAVTYEKQIYFNNDATNAAAAAMQSIRAGASLNTYFANSVQRGNVTLGLSLGGRNINYNIPAGTMITAPTPTLTPEPGRVLQYGGNPYPFSYPAVGQLNVVTAGTAAAVNAAAGFGPANVSYTDNLNRPDSASAKLIVADWTAGNGPAETLLRKGANGANQTFQTNNYNFADLSGSTNADTPMDSTIHSARSIAGVQIAGTPYIAANGANFARTTAQRVNSLQITNSGPASNSGLLDPVFAFVVDLTQSTSQNLVVTGAQEIMQENVIANGSATATINDTGITLTVDRSDPTADVSLQFGSGGPWVEDPYSYGADLSSASGLDATGIIPGADWNVSTSGDIETATLDWTGYDGSTGVPFDLATVLPDSSAYPNPNDTYEMEIGAFDGAYSNVWVPEASSLTLLASGLATLAPVWRRRHRTLTPTSL